MITAQSSLVDVAFEVCTALDAAGIVCVLVGGSAANFYAPSEYQSDDIDFVIQLMPRDADGQHILGDIGFSRRGEMYVHASSRYTLEFPGTGPMGVGSDVITRWESVRRGGKVLYVVSRTDCVRDRLAAFYFWGDVQSLYAAIDVARSGPIDLEKVRDWSGREGAAAKFADFERRLHRAQM